MANDKIDFQPIDFEPLDSGLSEEDKSALSGFIRESPEKVSGLESVVRGGAQGLSYGTADEIEAGIRAALDPKEEYAQKIKSVRQDYETARESSPGKYLIGELIGGVAAPGGNVLAGAKGATAALGRVATGAGLGGLAGLGTSDADLTNLKDPEQLEKAKSDTLSGAGFGALGSLGGEVIKGGVNFLKGTRLGQRFIEGRKLGLEGINLGSDEVKAGIAQDTLNRLQNLSQKIGLDIEDTMKKQEEVIAKSGAKVDVEDFLKNLEKELKAKTGYDKKDQTVIKEMLSTIENFKEGVKLNPKIDKAIKDIETPKVVQTIDAKGNPNAQQKIESKMAQLQSKADFEGKPIKYRTELDQENGVFRLIQEPIPTETNMSVARSPELLTKPQDPKAADLSSAVQLRKDIGRKAYDEEAYSENLNPVIKQNVGKLSEIINQADPELAKINEKLSSYAKTFENLGIDPRNDKAWVKFSDLVADLNKSGSMNEAVAQKRLTTFLEEFNKIDSPMKEVIKPEIDDILRRYAISSVADKEGLGGSLSRLGYTIGGIPAVAGSGLGLAEKTVKDTLFNVGPETGAAVGLLKKGLSKTAEGTKALGSAVKQGEFSTKVGATAKTILGEDIRKEDSRKEKSVSPSADLSRKLYDLPDQDYQKVAEIIEQDPELRSIASALRSAEEQKNKYQRNAIMFSLAQNPKARRLLGIGEEAK